MSFNSSIDSVLNGLSNGVSKIALSFTIRAVTPGGKVIIHPVLYEYVSSVTVKTFELQVVIVTF